jgi:hypothetical protein
MDKRPHNSHVVKGMGVGRKGFKVLKADNLTTFGVGGDVEDSPCWKRLNERLLLL